MGKINGHENPLAIFEEKVLDVKDMNYEFEINKNSVISIKKQEKIDKVFKENTILSGDGKIQINIKSLPTLMNTNSKTVRTKIYNDVKDTDKNIIDNQMYITSEGVTPMLIETRDNATTKQKEEICQRTLNNLNMVENLPEVKEQRTIARTIIHEIDKKNKKEALKQAKVCALTGEKLKEPVVHHDKSKAVYSPKEYLKKENYKVLEAKNHRLGHSSNILDNPNTTWEEKSKEIKKLKEEQK